MTGVCFNLRRALNPFQRRPSEKGTMRSVCALYRVTCHSEVGVVTWPLTLSHSPTNWTRYDQDETSCRILVPRLKVIPFETVVGRTHTQRTNRIPGPLSWSLIIQIGWDSRKSLGLRDVLCSTLVYSSLSCGRWTRATMDARCDKLAIELSWQHLRQSACHCGKTEHVLSLEFWTKFRKARPRCIHDNDGPLLLVIHEFLCRRTCRV